MRFDGLGEICVGLQPSTVGDAMAAALRLFSPSAAEAPMPIGAAATLPPPLAVVSPDVGADAYTFDQAATDYASARGLKPRAVNELTTTVNKFRAWTAACAHRSATPMGASGLPGLSSLPGTSLPAVEQLTRDVVAAFLDWVHRRAIAEQSGNPGRVANKAREHVRAVLTWGAKSGHVAASPPLPDPREQKSVAGLFFLTDAELDALYRATDRLTLRGCPNVGAYWRAALAVLVTYGVDTQLIWGVDQWAEPLRWRQIHPPGLSPDRQFRQESPHGWIAWRRQKNGRQFVAPLTAVVAAHLRAIAPDPAAADPAAAIFAGSGSAKPCRLFQHLATLAGIAPKRDPIGGQELRWKLQDLRKTCSTRHDETTPGSASAVLGHAAGDGLADVTRTHYRNQAPLLFRAIMATVYPPAFLEILK